MNRKVLKYSKLIIPVLWPLLAGTAAFFAYYKAFLYENINEAKTISDNKQMIIHLSSDMHDVQNTIHKYNLEIEAIKDREGNTEHELNTTLTYQQVLRKEVRSLAESKLNITEFWNLMRIGKFYVGCAKSS